MSFIRTLTTLAIGFAAARGVAKFRKAGGLDAMQDALRGAGQPGGMADQIGAMAEKLGLPGGSAAMREMMGRFGQGAAQVTEQAEAGFGTLTAAMTGAASAGAKNMGEMLGAMTGATPAGPIAEQTARLMIRAMIQAAKADGEIDAAERATILSHLSDASGAEIDFVQSELDAPLDIAALAASAGETGKEQLYAAALMPITVDSEGERQFLRGLAAALGLDAATLATLHAAAGKPQP
ncbi:MAG: tellurite resistance TerB family protein [Gemmobacter sp.]|nr:tellurite resistance TerB family protein [Gemmobacter sp.]